MKNSRIYPQTGGKNWTTSFVPVNSRTHVERVVNRNMRSKRHTLKVWFRNEPPEDIAFEVSCKETRDRKGFVAVYRLI